MTTKSPSRRRLRFRPQWGWVGILTLAWVMISGEANPFGIVGGFVISWLITVIFPMPPLRYRGRFNPWGFIVMVAALIRDLALSSWTLALQALNPRYRPVSGVVRTPLASDCDLYQVHTAELTSIVPGTVVIDARRRTRVLYLHVFDMEAQTADDVRLATLATDMRVVKAFGSRQEIEKAKARLEELT